MPWEADAARPGLSYSMVLDKSVHGDWGLLAGLGWVPLKISDTNKFLVFPRSKSQILDLPKPSSSQSLLCCFHLMSQSLYSSKLPQPEMSLMDPVPSAWKINAWTGLWWFSAAGDGWNSLCAASARARSSFAFKCLFLFCLGGRWMLLGSGAESREEAAFSQSPFWACLSCTCWLLFPVAHLGYQKYKAFLFFSSPYHPQEGPSFRNVVLLQLDP